MNVHCLNGSKTETHKHYFNSAQMDGQKEGKKNLHMCRWRKEKKDKYLKLLTMPTTILFYKNYKKGIIKHL